MTFDLKVGAKAVGAKFAGLGVATVVAFAIAGAPGVALAADGDATDAGEAVAAAPQQEVVATVEEAAPASDAAVTTIQADTTPTATVLDTQPAQTTDTTATTTEQPAMAQDAQANATQATTDTTEATKTDATTDTVADTTDATKTTTGDKAAAAQSATETEKATDATQTTTEADAKADVVAPTTTAETKAEGTSAAAKAETTSTATATAEATTAEATIQNPANVYRLYNPWSGEHLYTMDLSEATHLFTIGWRWESTAYQASTTTGTAVYRLYNRYSGAHFYTTDQTEYNYLGSIGWNKENTAWYAFGDTTLFRLYNPYSGEHLYTTDANERDTAARAGWRKEGTAWTVTPGFREIAGRWIVSSAYGSQERYWIASNTQLAKNRYITPSEGTGYSVNAYATGSGAVVRNRTHVGNGVMFADNDGRLVNVSKGWLVTSSIEGGDLQRYYITSIGTDSTGKEILGGRTGWFSVDGANYYGFYTHGYVAHNMVVGKDNNNIYEADNDGKLTQINNYKSSAWKYANNVGSSTGWFLANSLNNYRAMVFHKLSDQDPWAMVKDFLCGYGNNTFLGRYTILGRFMTKDNGYQYTLYNTYYAYAPNEGYSTRWQMYHGALYFSKSHAIAETGLGQKVSGGCIRLADENAKYIYENVPDGTVMYTYH